MGIAGIPDVRRAVTVIGSGDDLTDAQQEWPFEVGRWIARAGHHLLTGGGGGVMEAAGRGFCSVDRAGVAIGVIPAGARAELLLALARARPCPIVVCVRDGETVGDLGRADLAARGLAIADTTDDVARLLR
jgi:hypothetical protein